MTIRSPFNREMTFHEWSKVNPELFPRYGLVNPMRSVVSTHQMWLRMMSKARFWTGECRGAKTSELQEQRGASNIPFKVK